MKLLQLILSVVLFTAILAEPKRFDNYKVYEVEVLNKEQVNILRSLERNTTDGYEFWNSPIIGRRTDIMVPPEKIDDFEQMIKHFNMDLAVKVFNLQELVNEANQIFEYTDTLRVFQFNRSRNTESIATGWIRLGKLSHT